ncbi:hypothetical protein [Mycobacteroides abscessus]|uniref:hypothetical protein n=1 Tax=Mycobacteroides abscessus TaxID=36809 RepID=UPI0005DC9B9E|nr:hypothetical protein [Mycobacteroides abscessus]CPR69631.1 Uncharacterised protein [Mycobacteroides abscessus]CPU70582.1 Uncharacterised protein [Mycobacteroides abscessus]
MANEDKDLSSIDAMPDPDVKPTPAAQGDAVATAIQTTAVGIGTDSDGKTPEDVAADAAAAATTTRDLAATAVTVADAVRILKKAAAEWRKNAPKKSDFDAAEKELSDARTQMGDAESASGDTSAASKRVDDALARLRKITADRKAADDAFDREWKKAVAKLKTLKGAETDQDGDSPGAPGKPATPGSQSTGSGAPGGAPAAKPGSGTPAGTPKPAGTPAATPPSSTPTSTNGKSSDTDLNTALAAAALAGQGQQNQQPQQAATTTPQASTPQAPQQQNQGDKDKGDPAKTLLEEATRNGEQALGLAGITNPATTVTGAGSPQSPTPAPVANTNGTTTTFRPANAAIPGTLPGGTPAPQPAPAVSGRSFENLNTQSDVGGRPPGTENKPFAPGAPGTSTSGAHGGGNTAQSQAAAQQQAQRGAGMPMMPAVPMSGSPAPSGGGTRGGDEKDRPTVTSTSDPLGLMTERSQSVRGGTIAQNRPDHGDPAAA